ncbi:hypothetical protein CGT82_06890 [Vibrio cholerae]|nr:hypothetical protein CGT82_06890 [Vibrio cholerae]
MAIADHSRCTSSALAVVSALAFKPRQVFRWTGSALQGDKPTQNSIIQNTAFNTIHAWAGVVGQADFALWPVAIGD